MFSFTLAWVLLTFSLLVVWLSAEDNIALNTVMSRSPFPYIYSRVGCPLDFVMSTHYAKYLDGYESICSFFLLLITAPTFLLRKCLFSNHVIGNKNPSSLNSFLDSFI